MEGREVPALPKHLLHGRGHCRGTELLLCDPAGRGRGKVQGHVPVQGQGVHHIGLVDVREDMDNLQGEGETLKLAACRQQGMHHLPHKHTARALRSRAGCGSGASRGQEPPSRAAAPIAEHVGLAPRPTLTSPMNRKLPAATGCPIHAWR